MHNQQQFNVYKNNDYIRSFVQFSPAEKFALELAKENPEEYFQIAKVVTQYKATQPATVHVECTQYD